MTTTPIAEPGVNTLAVDIGGTGLKASVLDLSGNMEHDRVRVPTPYPLSPVRLVDEIEKLIKPLPSFDRVSVGFPGVVRGGQVVSAPHFVSPQGPGGKPASKLVRAWDHYDLQSEVERVTGKPTRAANDADVQGSAVVSGEGFEVVLTLGTGLGSALFLEGKLLPHLELAHHPFRKGQSYNEAIGEATRKAIGRKKWHERVFQVIETIRLLTFFDQCFVGGGNASRLNPREMPSGVTIVSNDAGITGGVKLWERI
jgi:polyphosphate glucokinase